MIFAKHPTTRTPTNNLELQ